MDILNEDIIMEIILERKQSTKALLLIEKIFNNKFDKANKPYINHLKRVASNFQDEERYTISLLHDTLEDTSITYNDLLNLGFKEKYLDCLLLLTKTNNTSYEDYIDRIITSNDSSAMDVKLADLKDNMNEDRLNLLNADEARRLLNKYTLAYNKIIKRRDELK